VRELIQITENQKPQFFIWAPVSGAALLFLAQHLKEVAAMKGLTDDPQQSAEERKAKYAGDESEAA
jgi:hypothetical protein